MPVPGNYEDISSDEAINLELEIIGQENIRLGNCEGIKKLLLSNPESELRKKRDY